MVWWYDWLFTTSLLNVLLEDPITDVFEELTVPVTQLFFLLAGLVASEDIGVLCDAIHVEGISSPPTIDKFLDWLDVQVVTCS